MRKPTIWFPTRSDTNWAVQSQKMVTAKLICTSVFAYADCWFSHVAAHILTGHGFNIQLQIKMPLFLHIYLSSNKKLKSSPGLYSVGSFPLKEK